jgi:hypothetical protein
MPEINLVDQTLKNYHNQTELSIQVSLNGFSFCISTLPDRTIRAFKSYRFEGVVLLEELISRTNDILRQDELLRLPYQKMRVMPFNRTSTLIPHELFRPEQLKKLMQFNQPLDDLDEIHFNTIAYCSSNLVFTVQTYLAGIFTEKFKAPLFYNQAASLIKLAELHLPAGKEDLLLSSCQLMC